MKCCDNKHHTSKRLVCDRCEVGYFEWHWRTHWLNECGGNK